VTTPHPPGWYDDPHDPNAQRYWDGQDWTPHRQRKQTSAPAQPPVMPAQPPVTPAQPPVMPAQPPVTPAQPPVMPAQPPVTATQSPAVALGAQQQNMPSNHLVWAVFSFLACFPLGLIAIINAIKVSNLWALGQYDAARAASASARKFAMWATIGWVVVWGGFLLFWIVIVVIGASTGTSTSP
jgi:hypothetical protein